MQSEWAVSTISALQRQAARYAAQTVAESQHILKGLCDTALTAVEEAPEDGFLHILMVMR